MRSGRRMLPRLGDEATESRLEVGEGLGSCRPTGRARRWPYAGRAALALDLQLAGADPHLHEAAVAAALEEDEHLLARGEGAAPRHDERPVADDAAEQRELEQGLARAFELLVDAQHDVGDDESSRRAG